MKNGNKKKKKGVRIVFRINAIRFPTISKKNLMYENRYIVLFAFYDIKKRIEGTSRYDDGSFLKNNLSLKIEFDK